MVFKSTTNNIGGIDKVVEIDETLIVKRKYERGRLLAQTWLFGAIERQSKHCVVVPLVEPGSVKRDAATLVPLIKKYILPGSVIVSDSWRAYCNLSKENYTQSYQSF